MIKRLVLVCFTLNAIFSYSQEGTASPYSFYGIGSLNFKGTVENRSMGGLSIYNDSIHVNLRNPASYGGDNLAIWGNQSRPVKFTVGGDYSSVNLKSDFGSDEATSANFNYLAVAFPVGKFGFGFGLLPYTSVGHKLESLNENGDIQNRFNGQGGLNKVFFSLGCQLAKGLSVGVDFQYNFGNIQNSTIAFQYDNGVPVQYQSRESNRSDLSGLNYNFGLNYKMKLTEKLELTTAVTYMPQSDLMSQNDRAFSVIAINASTGQEFEFENIAVDLEALDLDRTALILPSTVSFGAGIGAPRKWFLGAEYSTTQTSRFSNILYDNDTTLYEDGYVFSLGGFFIPQYNSYSSFLNRVVYRAGIRFEKTGLNINNQSIEEFGISFGLGLPVGDARLLSNANLGFEVGRKGTTQSELIQENFVTLQLSLSLNDRWFQKRKYD